MRSYSFSKICPRQEPERGSLAKFTQADKPVSSTPVLTLPPEVRACIFKYLLDEADLIFKFSQDFDSSSCQARWQDDKKLAFLRACRLFEVEALNLVQVHNITVEIDSPPVSDTSTPGIYNERSKHVLWRRPKIALPLQQVRPHIQQLTIDARYALYHLLRTNILETFPKLRTIRIKQTLWPRVLPSGYRAELDKKPRRDAFILDSLDQHLRSSLGYFVSRRASSNRSELTPLIDLLRNPKLQPYYPLFVDATIEEYSASRHSCHSDIDDSLSFPISKQISAIRMTYNWPSQKMLDLEVDMYDQFMPLAIKSKYIEKIDLATPDEDNGNNELTTAAIDAELH